MAGGGPPAWFDSHWSGGVFSYGLARVKLEPFVCASLGLKVRCLQNGFLYDLLIDFRYQLNQRSTGCLQLR